jgi:hypothetical protein
MSAPRRQSKDPLERYDTPAWMTLALFAYAEPLMYSGRFVEPCAGKGAIMRVVRAHEGCKIIGADIDPRAHGIRRLDTLRPRPWPKDMRGTDVITNPPFSRGADAYRVAFANGARSIALLLRLNWLEPVDDRADIPSPHRLIILPRIGGHWFAGKATDNVTVAWHVWDYDRRLGVLEPIRRVPRSMAFVLIEQAERFDGVRKR